MCVLYGFVCLFWDWIGLGAGGGGTKGRTLRLVWVPARFLHRCVGLLAHFLYLLRALGVYRCGGWGRGV